MSPVPAEPRSSTDDRRAAARRSVKRALGWWAAGVALLAGFVAAALLADAAGFDHSEHEAAEDVAAAAANAFSLYLPITGGVAAWNTLVNWPFLTPRWRAFGLLAGVLTGIEFVSCLIPAYP